MHELETRAVKNRTFQSRGPARLEDLAGANVQLIFKIYHRWRILK